MQHKSLIYLLCLFLTACGGGSLDSDSNNPDPLVLVSAGADQLVDEGVIVQLSGDASGQTDALTFAWTATPDIAIDHPDTSSAAASFVAPTTTEVLTYTLSLRVTDGNGNQATDSLSVQVQPVNESPIAVVQHSLSGGESLESYPAGIEIVLDGSQSNDPDAVDTTNPIVAYNWQQLGGENVLTDVSLDGVAIAFISPIAADSNQLEFSLTVTDAEGAQDSQTLTLTIQSESDTLPQVFAGVNHQVFVGETIVLHGEASSTVPNAAPLSYAWSTDSVLTPAIDDASADSTFAIAPGVDTTQTATFTLEVTDQFGNQVQDSVTVSIRPLPLQPLNDTGVSQEATVNTLGADYQGAYPGQDGQRGQDIINRNGLLEKAGRGDQGFDFTRLDAIGDEVDDVTQPWRCVRDNVTGLIWEAKSNDGGLRDASHSYSWYFSDNNGDINGDLNGAGTNCTLSQCNTTSYVDQINSQGLCGFFDWRLPTHNELLSIMHFGKASGALIDTDYFPNTLAGVSTPAWYWVREANVDGVNDDGEAQNAWAIDFASGNDNFLLKSTAASVRLVRAGR